MKKILITALLSLFAASAFAAHPMCGKTELAELMDGMKGDMKALKKAAKSEDTDKVTLLARDLLVKVQKADQYVPLAISDTAELSEEQQAEYKRYQQGIAKLEDVVQQLTVADTIDGQKIALAEIGKTSKKGHKAFRMDCD